MAERYFADKGIAYRHVDVSRDRRGRREMVLMTGQQGVPVVRVGERAMVGWDPAEFRALVNGRGRRR